MPRSTSFEHPERVVTWKSQESVLETKCQQVADLSAEAASLRISQDLWSKDVKRPDCPKMVGEK